MKNGQNTNKRVVCLSKCKPLYANKRFIIDSVVITVSAFEIENMTFAVTRCKNTAHFSKSSLRAILRSPKTEFFDGAVAYSVDGNKVFFKEVQVWDRNKTNFFAICALLSELCLRSPKKDFSLFNDDDEKCYFLRIFSDFAVLEETL